MLEISPLTAQATQSGVSSVFRDALLELRAEGAAEDPSGKPTQNTIPDTVSSVEETPPVSAPVADPEEYTGQARPGEFVIGPLQIATVAFVGILLVGVVSAGFYLAGRGHLPVQKTVEASKPVVAAQPPVLPQIPAAVQQKPPELAPLASGSEGIVKPELNKAYLQLMSVEAGVAEVMASGLRQKGVPALVSPGVNDKVARLLVGPYSNPADITAARTRVEQLGFHPFARLFTERDFLPPQPPPPTPLPVPTPPAALPEVIPGPPQ